MMVYYVYILQSRKYGRYYIGVSNDVKRRLSEHNNGLSRSTAPYRPFVLVRVEGPHTIEQAYARESFLKSKKSRKILHKVIESSPDVLAEQEIEDPRFPKGKSGLSW